MQERSSLLFDKLSYREKDTEALGAALAGLILQDDGGKGTFVALYGDLGAGKTAFVRGMASVLTPGAHVTSPTYAIVNEYREKILFRHLDLYRITGEDDLCSVGFFDFLGEGIIAAEWCENIPDLLPLPRIAVTVEKTGEDTRRIRAEKIFSA